MRIKLIIYSYLFIPLLLVGQNQFSKFKHLTLEAGVSQSTIACIVKDSSGFMWFGTEDGLNKYDGTNFTVYRNIPNNNKSLSSSYINAIIEQENGFLWIGTNNGLNYFDPTTEEFTRYLHDPNDPKSLSHNEVIALEILKNGKLLVGTHNGLNLFDPEVGFLKYKPENTADSYHVGALVQDSEGDIWVLSSGMIEKVKLDHGGIRGNYFKQILRDDLKYTMLLDGLHIWIGTNNGLLRFNPNSRTFKMFRFYGEDGTDDIRNGVLAIDHGPDNTLWVGTNGGGLIQFDKKLGKIQVIQHNPYNRFSLNSSAIRSLFFDETGILWLGTYGGGINKYDPNQYGFRHYKHYPGDKNSLSENSVRSILLDQQGELWVGTHGGLNRINRKTNHVEVYSYKKSDTTTISSNLVRALDEDADGVIWAGTWENGLNSFNKKTKKFKRYLHLPGRKNAIGQIRTLKVGTSGDIWFGGDGVWRFNPKTNQSSSYFYKEKNKGDHTPKAINSLYFTTSGTLWIGTQNGLRALDTVTNTVKRYNHDPEDSSSLSHGYVTSLAQDEKGFLWVGTYGGGLNVLNIDKGVFKHYTTSNGLKNDVIYGILIDQQGFVWFTSNAGLGRFDPKIEEFKYFGVEDGIQSVEFNAGAYAKSSEGEFFFGGINGFNSYYPHAINNNKKTARIVFTDFELVEASKNHNKFILNKHIAHVKEIKLKHNQNTLRLKFAELNYADKVDNMYEYQLEGLKGNWVNLEKKRLITLGDLAPGRYTLHVRIQKDITKKIALEIVILPAIWQTKWSYSSYGLIFLIITLMVYRNVGKMKQVRRQFELKLRSWEENAKIQNENDNGTLLFLEKVEVTSADQQFLERAIRTVEAHIENSGFGVEKFMDEMCMSRSQLHRKLKTLTGYSTTKFIRLIRLKRAAQLLKGNTGTVSEIAYKVGFDNTGYFSKCFRETFGKTPSQYYS